MEATFVNQRTGIGALVRRLAMAVGITLLVLFVTQGGSSRLQPGEAVAAGGGPEMALTVTQGGFCVGNDCYAEVGEDFMLAVDLVEIPVGGYILMQTYLDFGIYDPTASENGAGPNSCSDGVNNGRDLGLDRTDEACAITSFVYTPSANPATELIWADLGSGIAIREESGPGLVTHAGLTGLMPPLPQSTYTGIGIEIQLTCPASAMEAPIILYPYDDPLVARTNGALFIEYASHVRYTPKVDTITMHCIAKSAGDTDGDGCSDATENGSDPAQGGDRDWLNPWDFYDVAGPGGSNVPDGVGDLPNDSMQVAAHYAPLGYPPNQGYEQYDRGPAAGLSWVDTQPPDGVIDLPNDLLGLIQQFGHSCA